MLIAVETFHALAHGLLHELLSMNTPDREKLHCRRCRCRTWHQLLHCYDTEIDEKKLPVTMLERSAIFRCCGCESIALRLSQYQADMAYDEVKALEAE